jgi:hypothetical protein
MVTQAVSAGKDWLTPLAVLVPILTAPVLVVLLGAGGHQAFRLLLIFGGLAAIAAAFRSSTPPGSRS